MRICSFFHQRTYQGMNQILIQAIIVTTIISGIVSPPGPGAIPPTIPVFESMGPNQLLLDLGATMRTISGMHYIQNATASECGYVCFRIRPDCCDSFMYNPALSMCQLKKRPEGTSTDTQYNSDGWQSYWFYDVLSSFDLIGLYEPKYITITSLEYFDQMQDYYYISVGNAKLAADEGEAINTFHGQQYINETSTEQCANACDATMDCDGFSYNPYKENGKCYLKKNSANGKFEVVDNADGWTFYWREGLSSTSYDCWHPCTSDYRCIPCKEQVGCRAL
eukprot:TRINITY_DN3228_c0_g1_i2.p1 TRINITY_DN3228_c0_g1~~TRINITY_DN3228_c0_g1_i2.p1  ORF type:complete len:279 (-),score=6.17 TRINITY_DN3228_c0_g1_i2:755-1591(-)